MLARQNARRTGCGLGGVNMAVIDDVRLIISEQVGIPIEHLSADSRLAAIGVESLDVIEIVFALEERFKIAIEINVNESAPLAFETIGQVAAAVQKLLDSKQA